MLNHEWLKDFPAFLFAAKTKKGGHFVLERAVAAIRRVMGGLYYIVSLGASVVCPYVPPNLFLKCAGGSGHLQAHRSLAQSVDCIILYIMSVVGPSCWAALPELSGRVVGLRCWS